MEKRTGAPWWLVILLTVTAAFVSGFAMWIYAPKPVQKAAATPPVTVTQTVGVTVTATPSRPPSAPSKPASPQWVVRTPAGMACVLDDRIITCTGTFDSGAQGYYWAAGTSSAAVATTAVQLPGAGETLAYGVRRSAGPWTISMERSGVTFEHGPTGSKVTFNKSGATVG